MHLDCAPLHSCLLILVARQDTIAQLPAIAHALVGPSLIAELGGEVDYKVR